MSHDSPINLVKLASSLRLYWYVRAISGYSGRFGVSLWSTNCDPIEKKEIHSRHARANGQEHLRRLRSESNATSRWLPSSRTGFKSWTNCEIMAKHLNSTPSIGSTGILRRNKNAVQLQTYKLSSISIAPGKKLCIYSFPFVLKSKFWCLLKYSLKKKYEYGKLCVFIRLSRSVRMHAWITKTGGQANNAHR